jgi:HAD superfamily hydrolase (TIGR01549 family)
MKKFSDMMNTCHDFWDMHEDVSQEEMTAALKKLGPWMYEPRTDLKRLFDHLHEAGHEVGLLTSRDSSVQHYIDEFGIRDRLDIVVDFDDVHTKKPDPMVFDPVFEEGYDAGTVVYVGDAFADRQAAESAGVRFVGIVSNLNSHGEFEAEGLDDDHIIYSLTEILNLLKKLE